MGNKSMTGLWPSRFEPVFTLHSLGRWLLSTCFESGRVAATGHWNERKRASMVKGLWFTLRMYNDETGCLPCFGTSVKSCCVKCRPIGRETVGAEMSAGGGRWEGKGSEEMRCPGWRNSMYKLDKDMDAVHSGNLRCFVWLLWRCLVGSSGDQNLLREARDRWFGHGV